LHRRRIHRPEWPESRQSLGTTIADAIREAAARLTTAGLPTGRLDVEVLLRHVLKVDRTRLFLRLREPLPDEDRAKLDELVERRLAGEPVAYLTGTREFMGLSFAVGPGVLIPRPETELLVEWALAWLQDRPAAVVVDVGTGSGAIALTLGAARRGPGGAIVGVDQSAAALGYAAANRRTFDLAYAVRLVRGDLLTWCRGPIDLILANLPYLRPEQVADNPELGAEPAAALVGGSDGLDAIRRLLADLPRVLAPGGAVALEIDPSQSETAREEARSALPAARIDVVRDLAGRNRIVVAVTGNNGQTGDGSATIISVATVGDG
jgi:release factor glutamine methyltransferase